MKLHAAFAALPMPLSVWDGRHQLASLRPGAQTLAELPGSPALPQMIGAKQAQAKGGDARLGCAYFIGDLAWALGRLLGGLWLKGWYLHAADPSAISISLRPVPWEAGGDAGINQVIDVTADPAGFVAGPDDPGQFALAFAALHEGVILASARLTGLGPAAQWRLVADGLSMALLDQGKRMGAVECALAVGRTALSNRRTPIWTKQGEYAEVQAPPDLSEWFRLRSGCCRYHTSQGGDYCTTCVHRDRNDQIARLKGYLQELHSNA